MTTKTLTTPDVEMKTQFHAVLIDPYKNTVENVTYNGDYRHIYELCQVRTFDYVPLQNTDDLFVDDEGLCNLTAETRFFVIEGDTQPLAGRGLILNHDKDGESIAAKFDAEYYRPRVKFYSLNDVRAMTLAGSDDE
jgi:hypothetical protein